MNPIVVLEPWMAWTMGIGLLVFFFVTVGLAKQFQKPKSEVGTRVLTESSYAETVAQCAIEDHVASVPDGGLNERARARLTLAGYTNDRGTWRRAS